MEEENNLFSLQTNDGIYYWDLVRVKLFEQFIFYDQNINSTKVNYFKKIKKNISKLTKYFCGILVQETFRFFTINFKKFDNVFLLCSREKLADKTKIDKAFFHLLKIAGHKSFIIESALINVKTKYKKYFPFKLILMEQLANSSFQIDCNFIIDILNKYFGDVNNSNSLQTFINKEVSKFRYSKIFYFTLLKKIKPKQLFITRGLQHGILSAAHDLKITTIELQHGTPQGNMMYVYPKNIQACDIRKILPDYMITFSDFFKDELINYPYPLKGFYTVGNDLFALKKFHHEIQSKSIIFLYSDWHHNFIDVIIDFANLMTEYKIYIKLHPSATSNPNEIKEMLKKFSNVTVILNEINAVELLKSAASIAMIQSTLAYEALQAGLKVYIYKDVDYRVLEDIFTNKNVHLFSSALELTEKLKINFDNDQKTTFFDGFNEKELMMILSGKYS